VSSPSFRSLEVNIYNVAQSFTRKYQYMETNLKQRKKGLLTKIPDIEKTLAMAKFLRDRRVCLIAPPQINIYAI